MRFSTTLALLSLLCLSGACARDILQHNDWGDYNDHDSNDELGQELTDFSSSVSCKAASNSDFSTTEKDLLGDLVRSVVEIGCQEPKEVIKEVNIIAKAKAIAETVTAVAASCTSSGKGSFGCAFAGSAALAYAEATVDATFTALVKALFNLCECDNGFVQNDVAVVAVNKQLLDLTSKSFSAVFGALCTDDDNKDVDLVVVQKCVTENIITLLAQAVLKLTIQGNCGSGDPDAVASVDASLKVFQDKSDECKLLKVDVSDGAFAIVFGDGDTSVESSP